MGVKGQGHRRWVLTEENIGRKETVSSEGKVERVQVEWAKDQGTEETREA